jgi:lipoate-protein ligase A
VIRPVRLGLFFDGPEDGARAMARDEVIVELLRDPADLTHAARAHGWLHPTLSLGRGQSPPDELLNSAAELGVEVVRRPTGGGWLLHLPGDLAITVVVAGPLGSGDLRRAARLTAQAIALGMASCGKAALVFTGMRAPATRADICFARADRDEVVVGASKVAGVALARLGRSALVQSAAPLVAESRELARFAQRWDERRKEAVAGAGGVDREDLWRATADALARLLETSGVARDWPAAALKRAESLRHAKYRDLQYTREGRFRRHAPAAGDAEP